MVATATRESSNSEIEEQCDDLFGEYLKFRNKKVRDTLVLLHMNLVRFLANKFANRGEPIEDLVQVGVIGLINSIERFDPDRGTKFTTYATPTIVGEIRRHFRDKAWSLKVPRRLQELNVAGNKATGELSAILGRQPTAQEIADKIGASEEETLEAIDLGNAYDTLSLDSKIGGDGEDAPLAIGDFCGDFDPRIETIHQYGDLRQALDLLDPREKAIICLRFFKDMHQTAVGERLNISQMHVSRLQQKALKRLAVLLNDDALMVAIKQKLGESRLESFEEETTKDIRHKCKLAPQVIENVDAFEIKAPNLLYLVLVWSKLSHDKPRSIYHSEISRRIGIVESSGYSVISQLLTDNGPLLRTNFGQYLRNNRFVRLVSFRDEIQIGDLILLKDGVYDLDVLSDLIGYPMRLTSKNVQRAKAEPLNGKKVKQYKGGLKAVGIDVLSFRVAITAWPWLSDIEPKILFPVSIAEKSGITDSSTWTAIHRLAKPGVEVFKRATKGLFLKGIPIVKLVSKRRQWIQIAGRQYKSGGIYDLNALLPKPKTPPLVLTDAEVRIAIPIWLALNDSEFRAIPYNPVLSVLEDCTRNKLSQRMRHLAEKGILMRESNCFKRGSCEFIARTTMSGQKAIIPGIELVRGKKYDLNVLCQEFSKTYLGELLLELVAKAAKPKVARKLEPKVVKVVEPKVVKVVEPKTTKAVKPKVKKKAKSKAGRKVHYKSQNRLKPEDPKCALIKSDQELIVLRDFLLIYTGKPMAICSQAVVQRTGLKEKQIRTSMIKLKKSGALKPDLSRACSVKSYSKGLTFLKLDYKSEAFPTLEPNQVFPVDDLLSLQNLKK